MRFPEVGAGTPASRPLIRGIKEWYNCNLEQGVCVCACAAHVLRIGPVGFRFLVLSIDDEDPKVLDLPFNAQRQI